MQNRPIKIQEAEKHYPSLLREIPKAPSEIYILGNMKSWEKPCVAIVGTRKATSYGLKTAYNISYELASAGITIVSGLALGIDAEAHKGAVDARGTTIAVLGSGINKIYPAANRHLAEKIINQNGSIVSEFSPDLMPDKWTFPQRNRIIAGLSLMTLVIEAPEKSGSLITAYLALDFNREVGAVPGEIISINSKGTNNLIKLGAHLIISADDVLNILGFGDDSEKLDNLDKIEKVILQCLDKPQTSDEILKKIDASLETMNQKLSMLELRGMIKNSGGVWQKIY